MNKKRLIKALIFIYIIACLSTSCSSGKGDNNSSMTNQTTPGNPALEASYNTISIEPFSDSINHARYQYENKIPPYEFYDPSQIAGIAENLINYQNEDGGWPKNVDWTRKWNPGEYELEKIPTADNAYYHSTLDNRSTYTQIEYLAQVYQQLPDQKYSASIKMGVDWLIKAQHPESGGFAGADVDAITYNDDVMTGTLRLLRQIAVGDELYSFLDQDTRDKALSAYEKGIDCILRTQIIINGKLTAWGQQHDHQSLEPIWARDYEPPSITANESVGILVLLMEIEDPAPEIKEAITAGCEWLASARISGIKTTWVPAEPVMIGNYYSEYEKIVEPARGYSLWARFYDLQTQQPVFYDWGRKQVAGFNELGRERRI